MVRSFSGMSPSGGATINGVPQIYASNSTICYVNSAGSNCQPPVQVTVAQAVFARCPEDSIKVGNTAYKFDLVLYSNAPNYEFKCVRSIPKNLPPNQCPTNPDGDAQGDPIHPSTGQQVQTEIDYESADGALKYSRTYRSTTGMFSSLITANLVASDNLNLKLPPCYPSWTTLSTPTGPKKKSTCFSYRSESADRYKATSSLGRPLDFNNSAGVISSLDNGRERLVKYTNSSGQIEWHLNNPDASTEIYNAKGQLIGTRSNTNKFVDYIYSDAQTASSIAPRPDLLIYMRDKFSGRQLQFFYNSDGQMTKMLNPQGGEYKYVYDEFNNLTSVTYPDNRVKNYFYNEAANINGGVACSGNTEGFPRLMTGFTDESGIRFADIKYQCDGKAVSAEHVGGVEKFAFDYSNSGYTVVTDPLNTARKFSYTKISNANYPSGVGQPGGSGCSASSKNLSYSTKGLVTQKTEFNGNITLYGYGTNDLEDRRVEGLTGSSSTSLLDSSATLPAGARKISTEWHADWRKATRIAEPRKITTNIYNGQPDPFLGGVASCAPNGVAAPLLCKKVEQATIDSNGASGFSAILDTTIAKREWRYTYNEAGKLLTVMAPQNIATATIGTQYEYYSADGSNWKKNDLKQIKNALGHLTQYISYDANGRLLEMIDANGVHRSFTYDLRGRILSSQIGSALTRYSYDLAGNLSKVILPDASEVNFSYDAAHRLVSVSDKLGNHIDYTLDNAGNKTNTLVRDAGGVLRYQQQKFYDALSRVQKIVDTQSHETTYLYDANGNPTGVTDPKQHSTSHQFDALDQLKQTTDALSGKTEYSYDGQGNIKTVKDPRGNSTTYNYNAFGDLTSLVSPDTGTTTFTYDDAGNRTSATDARGVVVNYSYDALNRLRTVSYPASSSENVTYTYDSTANSSYGVGRLSSIATGTLRNDYVYNHQGLIVKKFTQVDSTLSTTQYSYDTAGNLIGITYPSGRSVTYTRDAAGRIQGITTKANANATAQTIASSMTYLPFGPVASFSYGNGLTHTNTFDTDYRLTNIQVGGVLSRGYSYDLADNITGISDGVASSKNQTLGYDALDRLTSAQGIYGTLGYTYDAVGNRQTETAGGTTATYTYETTSNRLSSIAKTNANRSFLYDVAGNRIKGTSDALKVQDYTYNNANRLTTLKENNTLVATYKYNALGQRVSKLLASQVQELYHYDEAGQLIAVTDASGNTVREYIYSGNELLGFVSGSSVAIPTTTITATTNQATLQNAVLAKTYSGYTGSAGYIQFNGEGQASWPVTIAATANHTIQVSYALASGTRAMDLYIDGVKKTTVSFASTTAWTKWSAASVTLNLTAGNHTLMLKTTGASGPNLDRVRLTPVAGQTTGSASLYYVHNDHKSTPQIVTAQNQSVVWMADYQPFGKLQPNQSNSIELYSRFPGQFVDQESGIYYNYFRDYDPSIGRYIESDPIGLNGGINTYAYVGGGNPIRLIDPLGLWVITGSFGGESTPGKGYGGEVGGYYDTVTGSYGGYVTTKETTGLLVDVGFGFDIYDGDVNGFSGNSTTEKICIMFGCINIHRDSNGKFYGLGAGAFDGSNGFGGGFSHHKNETTPYPKENPDCP